MGGRQKKKPKAKTSKRKATAAKKRKAETLGKTKPRPSAEKTAEEAIGQSAAQAPLAQEAQSEKAERKEAHKFVILKNYPESKHYEVMKKRKGLVASILEKLGLKSGV